MKNSDHATDIRPLLLVGWHAKALDALTARGREVLCAIDPREKEEARRHGVLERCIVVADSGNAEAVLSGLARSGLDLAGFAGVWSARELGLIPAGVLATLAGCDGMPYSTAIALRDKYTQKSLVRAAGLPVTDCRIADETADIVNGYTGGRVVIKPLAGAATRDTYVAADQQEVVQVAEHLAEGARGPWLVEGFVEGAELHLDGVVRGGELVLLGISRYLQNVIEIRNGGVVGSVILEPDANKGLYAEGTALTRLALEALGHRDGVFHLEAFHSADGLVFSECAGRIGGGLIRDSILLRFGVDMVEAWADVVEGADFRPGNPDSTAAYGFIHVPAPEGRLVELPTQEEASELPGCDVVRIDARPGQVVGDTSAGSDVRAARVLVHGADEDEVRRRLSEVLDWFSGRIMVADASTEVVT